MRRTFFIVGPTSTGKSELAADVACEVGAEIVSADAFQIYQALDLLTAKPDASTLAKVPHHLIGTTPLREEMNAEKYRRAACRVIDDIHSRGKVAIVVGGSGLYVKALTHGLAALPEPDAQLREKLNAMRLDELCAKLIELDAETARKVDLKNRRRVVRAVEICLLTGKPASEQRSRSGGLQSATGAIWRSPLPEKTQTGLSASQVAGVFVYRDREELYARINQRVEAMFENGVIEEVRAAGEASSTALQMIGFREIRQLLDRRMSISQCVAAIQQATRRYAKRQLTWFRRQTNFSSLNLSLLTHNEAVKWILLRMSSERREVSGVRARE
ncbi:MAG: tRNA (adenosine(37)-N6)-dimethylallyltransferase MiaA [Verrucomicrobia bacterium]|nr:tRNA (adenosine(37)-N6)-dimethylallyltransferase MiaA [Verrucomicrobiota bacterium]